MRPSCGASADTCLSAADSQECRNNKTFGDLASKILSVQKLGLASTAANTKNAPSRLVLVSPTAQMSIPELLQSAFYNKFN
jgi:hypothetical protein